MTQALPLALPLSVLSGGPRVTLSSASALSVVRGVHFLSSHGSFWTKNERCYACGGSEGCLGYDVDVRHVPTLAPVEQQQRGGGGGGILARPTTTAAARLHGSLMTMSLETHGEFEEGKEQEEGFKAVVVRGTFDRLHEGHSLLLSRALSLVAPGGRLVVGISSGQLLSEKVLKELIQPFEIRAGLVERFLNELAKSNGQRVEIQSLKVEEAVPEKIVSDSELNCIVVSTETEACAHALNNSRRPLGLPPLKIVVLAIPPDEEAKGRHRYSSSLLRRESLGTYIPRARGDRLPETPLVTGPYMVGLTGGIAQGKSFVRELLKEKGAQVLDCDALGHLSYVPGTPAYHSMIVAFGRSIVSPVDGTIDRAVLGSIVFADSCRMDELKKIVWASVAHLVAEKKERMAEEGVKIFVAEAALLLEAQWEKEMNEIWVVFAPKDVSRSRLMTRNQINEEEANKRIRSQMSSDDRVALADVAIYNGWTRGETREQVDKAWKLLLERVQSKSSKGEVEGSLWFRWAGLMRRLRVNEEVAIRWWVTLKDSYSEPWRHYHTFFHLRALYALYHEYAHFIAQPHVFQLAIFFHRIVYHPSNLGTRANELSSSQTFDVFATEAGLANETREKVKNFILLDRKEQVASGDFSFFLDFNLGTLVIRSDEIGSNSSKARLLQEYKEIDGEKFEKLFQDHIQQYTDGSQLFQSHEFQSKYHSAAKFGGLTDHPYLAQNH